MRTAIFEPLLSTSPDGALTLREAPSRGRFIFRMISGLFPFGVGTFVAYVFLSGAGPKPVGGIAGHLLGWLIIAIFFMASAVAPVAWAFENWFVRRTYHLRATDRAVESILTVAGACLRRRYYALSGFDGVRVRYQPGALFGGSYFVVSLAGPQQRVDVGKFSQHSAAVRLAADLGVGSGLAIHDEAGENDQKG